MEADSVQGISSSLVEHRHSVPVLRGWWVKIFIKMTVNCRLVVKEYFYLVMGEVYELGDNCLQNCCFGR